MPIGDKCWKDWTIQLRIEMMRSRTLEVTKSVEEIAAETGTDEPMENLRSFGFWNAHNPHGEWVQVGNSPTNDAISPD